LPPPRPKPLQVVLPQQASHIMEQGCGTSMDTATVAMDLSANDAFPSWENDPVQHLSPRHTQGFLCSVVVSSISDQFLARRYLLITDATGSGATNNYSSSIGSQSGTWPTSEATEQDIMLPSLRAMPDFARVYSFLGSIFDPETKGHLQKLKEMDPIDAETVLLLMKNLSINLTSPNFEEHVITCSFKLNFLLT